MEYNRRTNESASSGDYGTRYVGNNDAALLQIVDDCSRDPVRRFVSSPAQQKCATFLSHLKLALCQAGVSLRADRDRSCDDTTGEGEGRIAREGRSCARDEAVLADTRWADNQSKHSVLNHDSSDPWTRFVYTFLMTIP